VCPYRFVQYYNPCTYGYSLAFWDWDRWQRELDWMALHGVTMPLALEGQEAIWHGIWRSFGVSAAELDRFTVGPAHLPWHRMGNINRLYGPTPAGWIRRKRELQEKILGRMIELGMTPVVPAFAGHVPGAFLRLHPSARIHCLLWESAESPGLPYETKTFFLDPGADAALFQEIGRRFITEYRRQFGVGEYYLADPFNELIPPVSQANRLEDLRRIAASIYGGIAAGDPNGKWVMQGWMFTAGWRFWNPENTRAFLSGVPDERMLIIDYPTDIPSSEQPAWRRFDGFYGKPWIQGMVHVFGGNDNVRGDLPQIASQPAETLADPRRGNLAGWGMLMEGIETNEVVYELMTDVGWSERKIDLETWIPAYCRARYGACPSAMREAWRLLLRSAYSFVGYRWSAHHAFQTRPSLEPKAVNIAAGPLFQRAVDRFLECADELGGGRLYRNDLIEFVAQAVGSHVDGRLTAACAAHRARNVRARDRAAAEALSMLEQLDAWFDVRPDRRLATWTERARSWADGPDEAASYDSNARCLVTFWGWTDLDDYASRLWSGLIGDYYRQRWSWFFRNLPADSAKPPSADAYQELAEQLQAWLSA
ncbi:MAG: alpha-N-acetylglucosaminidase, partial [Opitutaceae bacterium]